MKKMIVILFWTCSSFYANATTQTSDPASDEKILAILVKNCAGCHRADSHPGALFLNKARLSEKQTVRLITKMVENRKMPKIHLDFKQTSEGKLLLKWLKAQQIED